MSLTSQLDAVNLCLKAIGESPVNAVEGSQSADVPTATQTIDEIDRKVQGKGWSWNRAYSFTITPDQDGEIHLPSNTLRVDAAYGSETSYKYDKISQRGERLYNAGENTYVFAEALILDIVQQLEWDDLPEAARSYIAIRAARQMQGRLPADSGVDRILQSEEIDALATLEQHEDEVADTNQISGNSSVVNAIMGHGVRRRH